MKIFNLTTNDLEEILKIENSVFLSSWSQDNFKSELKRDITISLGIEKLGELLGYCFFWWLGSEVHLLKIAVKKDWQGLDVGKKLLKSLIDFAENNDVRCCLLEVASKNYRALKLYQNFGFSEVGRRTAYYKADGDDAILMSKYIK